MIEFKKSEREEGVGVDVEDRGREGEEALVGWRAIKSRRTEGKGS